MSDSARPELSGQEGTVSCMASELFVGLMSGTSLDGIDGVLVDFSQTGPGDGLRLLAHAHSPFPERLRTELLALNEQGGVDELHRSCIAANSLAQLSANIVDTLLTQAQVRPEQVAAIGAHGQTVRHMPSIRLHEFGYTVQLNNPSLLAELSGIGVVADFRSRDMAAGGQGAPLVPAFHRALFWRAGESIALLNLGGISNLTLLDGQGTEVRGFDCGPANVLMDHWSEVHTGRAFDEDGRWAASGRVLPRLLKTLLTEPYFFLPPPKSTGRDLFNPSWLQRRLDKMKPETFRAQDVQATLCELTAVTCCDALLDQAPDASELLVCGGGGLNRHLMARIQQRLPQQMKVHLTDARGLPLTQVEAAAFAWLARAHLNRQTGNLSTVTGATAPRILGAFYPA